MPPLFGGGVTFCWAVLDRGGLRCSAVEASQLHGLGYGGGNRAHLVGLGSFLHHPVQHLQELGGVLLAVDLKGIHDQSIGFLDVEVRRCGA